MFPSRTAPAISHNNFIGDFIYAKFLGVAGVEVISIQENITSCFKFRRDARMLRAVVSSSAFMM